jgi:hypothetical protein
VEIDRDERRQVVVERKSESGNGDRFILMAEKRRARPRAASYRKRMVRLDGEIHQRYYMYTASWYWAVI